VNNTRAAIMTAALLGGGLGLAVPAGAAPGAAAHPAVSASDWPMFHHDPAHLGVSPDTGISATTASKMKIAWQAHLGGGIFGSAAVVANATLGKTLVYVAGGRNLQAVNAQSGAIVWTFSAPALIDSSPAVFNGVIWVGSLNHSIYSVDATTGKGLCSFKTTGQIEGTAVVADPGDGKGPVVYIGDNGPRALSPPDAGHMWAIRASDCSLRWKFSNFQNGPAGVYDEPGFAKDAKGRPLVIFGSTDNDDAVYAVDARTGALAWRVQTVVGNDSDVGAGPTISAPGVNGLAGGAVYITGKDRRVYGINLTTGKVMWIFNIKTDSPGNNGESQSVAALVGNQVFVGWGAGLYDLNAVTGAKTWKVASLPDVISSPSVSGPSGDQVLIVGDVNGGVDGFDLQGKPKFSIATKGMILASPAVSGNMAFIGNATTGVLYALTPGA
jgi:outer membrane protein assembly factor BamB